MQVIKQLSENEFVVRMDESDKNTTDSVVVTDDYVAFGANHGFMLSSDYEGDKIYGEFGGIASNWIKGRHTVQIGIRDMVDIVLPLLQRNPNCQPEHLVRDGNPVYTYASSKIRFWENGVEKFALRERGSDKYTVLDVETYRAIKEGRV